MALSFRIKGIPFRYKGAINVEDCKTAEEVIIKAGLDWEVSKCPLIAKMPFDGVIDPMAHTAETSFVRGSDLYRDCPNAYATYRTDKNIPLGIVKEKYTEVQNIDAFGFFDNAIGKNQAIWQTAGFFGNGERIFVSAKLPDSIYVNGQDPVDNYLVFTTSHDGSSGVKILLTPIRVICENTLNAAIRNAQNYVSFRHTASVHKNIDTAHEILGICKEKTQFLSEQYEAMSKFKMTDKEVNEYFINLILSDTEKQNVIDTGHTFEQLIMKDWRAIEDSNVSMKKVNVLHNMREYYEIGPGQKPYLGTGWGAYNAVTGYYSNVDNAEGIKRFDKLVFGSQAVKIQTAGNLIAA